jgi:uncharacterized membrane protein HdeD (DUF308 family)
MPAILKNFLPWWVITLKGLVLIMLGLYTLFNPPVAGSEGFKILPFVGAVWLLSGAGFIILALFSQKTNPRWKWNLAEGSIDIITGAIITADTINTGIFAPYAVGAWAILAGGVAVSQAFVIKKSRVYKFWGVAFSWGVISILLGFLMLMSKPIFTALGIMYILAAIMIISGFYQIIISLKLKHLL